MLFGVECLGCGQQDVWLCRKCFQKLKLNSIDHCPKCRKTSDTGYLCTECRKKYYLDGLLAAGDFKDPLLAKLIKTYKYQFVKDISNDLSDFLVLFWQNILNISFLENNDLAEMLSSALIVPVPLHPRRHRWRGFNQTEIIAQKFSAKLKLSMDSDSLVRIKYKKPQAKLRAEKRKKNIINNFRWHGKPINQNVVLIDDIATTGSTLEACAKELKRNQAHRVWGLVVASGK